MPFCNEESIFHRPFFVQKLLAGTIRHERINRPLRKVGAVGQGNELESIDSGNYSMHGFEKAPTRWEETWMHRVSVTLPLCQLRPMVGTVKLVPQ